MIASTAHLNPDSQVDGKSVPANTSTVIVSISTSAGETSSMIPKTEPEQTSLSFESNSKPPTRAGSVEEPNRASATGGGGASTTVAAPAGATSAGTIYPGGARIDIRYGSSTQPLDHAIFQSIRACAAGTSGVGASERLKKMLACILVVGGTALTPGMLSALESR